MSSYMVAIQVVGAVSYNPIIPDDDNIIASEGKFTLLAQSPSVILFDPVIRSGIVRFEVNNERDLHGMNVFLMFYNYIILIIFLILIIFIILFNLLLLFNFHRCRDCR